MKLQNLVQTTSLCIYLSNFSVQGESLFPLRHLSDYIHPTFPLDVIPTYKENSNRKPTREDVSRALTEAKKQKETENLIVLEKGVAYGSTLFFFGAIGAAMAYIRKRESVYERDKR